MGGPSDHPGVTIVPLTNNLSDTAAQLTSAFAAGAEWLFNYDDGGAEFAVLVTNYKDNNEQ